MFILFIFLVVFCFLVLCGRYTYKLDLNETKNTIKQEKELKQFINYIYNLNNKRNYINNKMIGINYKKYIY